MKIVVFIVNAIFWLWAFILPPAIFGFLAFLWYGRSSGNLPYAITLFVIGLVLGVVLAEHIRKKHGLDFFFGKLLSTPELEDGKEKDENDSGNGSPG